MKTIKLSFPHKDSKQSKQYLLARVAIKQGSPRSLAPPEDKTNVDMAPRHSSLCQTWHRGNGYDDSLLLVWGNTYRAANIQSASLALWAKSNYSRSALTPACLGSPGTRVRSTKVHSDRHL